MPDPITSSTSVGLPIIIGLAVVGVLAVIGLWVILAAIFGGVERVHQFEDESNDGSGRPVPSPDVVEALRAGHKLEAVKLYKDATGASLMDSKLAVEEMQRRMGI